MPTKPAMRAGLSVARCSSCVLYRPSYPLPAPAPLVPVLPLSLLLPLPLPLPLPPPRTCSTSCTRRSCCSSRCSSAPGSCHVAGPRVPASADDAPNADCWGGSWAVALAAS
jgi:hypothetical protein